MNVQVMDVDMQDDQGYTPLHLAVMANHVNMAKLLLALGASTQIKDKFHQRTPLDEAKTAELKQLFHLFAHKRPQGQPTPTATVSAPNASVIPTLDISKTKVSLH